MTETAASSGPQTSLDVKGTSGASSTDDDLESVRSSSSAIPDDVECVVVRPADKTGPFAVPGAHPAIPIPKFVPQPTPPVQPAPVDYPVKIEEADTGADTLGVADLLEGGVVRHPPRR